jgi:dihydrofolate reductase
MFSLIVATDIKNGIAKAGKIPWHNKTDLFNFKTMTTGNVVVMGANTWDSLPAEKRPLPDRLNIILTSKLTLPYANRDIVMLPSIHSLFEFRKANAHIYKQQEWFIMGGATLYNYFLRNPEYLNKIYWTQQIGNYYCDKTLDIDLDEFVYCDNWRMTRDLRVDMINKAMGAESVYYELERYREI